jgi:lysophospholipase L1-like esterase
VKQSDVVNGKIRSISGGKIRDIKADLKDLNFTPKTIITYVGGNDLMDKNKSVEDVTGEHVLMLTEAKSKFPDTDIIVSELVPRTEIPEKRTKIKDFNQATKEWCSANSIKFIENEDCFELKSGYIDVSCYNMTEDTPAVHLNRRGTVRLLENMSKQVPRVKLSETLNNPEIHHGQRHEKRTYAQAASHGNRSWTMSSRHDTSYNDGEQQTRNDGFNYVANKRGCYNCGEHNHSRSTCKYEQRLRCRVCSAYGHKEKFCRYANN